MVFEGSPVSTICPDPMLSNDYSKYLAVFESALSLEQEAARVTRSL